MFSEHIPCTAGSIFPSIIHYLVVVLGGRTLKVSVVLNADT
jgi:hypothetical protein